MKRINWMGSAAVVVAMLTIGCYRNLPYRTPQAAGTAASDVYDPEPACKTTTAGCTHPYYQAYIEFDEFGEMWDPRQLQHAIDQIKKAHDADAVTCAGKSRHEEGPVRLFVFIHGWKNNAAES